MKLNPNSWHTSINNYVYGYGYSTSNNNLCPYFWGTLIAIAILVPFTIYSMIKSVLSESTKKNLVRYNFCLTMTAIGMYNFAVGGNSYMYYFVITSVGFIVLYTLYETRIFQTLFAGFLKPRPYKPVKARRPSMTIEMIKGWKNKHCPMIEWEE